MDYSDSARAVGIGFGQSPANIYSGALVGGQGNAPTPRTLNSAAGRLEALNERLSKAVEGLAMIASQIGAMTPVNGLSQGKNAQTTACGAVHRLNDAADDAHSKAGEIETYIASLQRALG